MCTFINQCQTMRTNENKYCQNKLLKKNNIFIETCFAKLDQISERADACVSVNLNELVMRHIPAVKRLLVVHKAWKFSLLDFLAAQHQHSAGKRQTHGILYTLQTEGPSN